MWLIEYQIVTKYQDFYHCGRWLHHHQSHELSRAILLIETVFNRAVTKRRGPGISPSYYERLPWLLSKENKRKIEPKEIPSCLIPRLLVVFTWQLEILVTTLFNSDNFILHVLKAIASLKTRVFTKGGSTGFFRGDTSQVWALTTSVRVRI